MSTKPLVLWAARKKWNLRYTTRAAEQTSGIFTTPDGPLPFRFESGSRRIHLAEETVLLDEYGWEVDEKGHTVFRSTAPRKTKEQTDG